VDSPEWKLVHRIVADLRGRKGLDAIWEEIDVEIRNEITTKWEGFCRGAFREVRDATAARCFEVAKTERPADIKGPEHYAYDNACVQIGNAIRAAFPTQEPRE
jgi:hypothetical protein